MILSLHCYLAVASVVSQFAAVVVVVLCLKMV